MNSIPDTDWEMWFPKIIQGGMGAFVSGWRLARKVSGYSATGETLGVVSGTALDRVVAILLQRGGKDADDIIRVLMASHFPEKADRVIQKYHKKLNVGIPVSDLNNDPNQHLRDLLFCANYAVVKLAQEGHDNPVGINYLAKVPEPLLAGLYGAVSAGVGYVLIWAGIATEVPEMLRAFSRGERAIHKIPIIGGPDYTMELEPEKFLGTEPPLLKKPRFWPITSYTAIATKFEKKPDDTDLYIVENKQAAGHNAPPRKRPQPEWQEEKDIDEIISHEKPVYLAGNQASREKYLAARARGAQGVQVGTAFAFCDDSEFEEWLRRKARRMAYNQELEIKTDPLASPTKFLFKVAQIPWTQSEEIVRETRDRACSACALRVPLQKGEKIAYQCPAGPEQDFKDNGGDPEDLKGKVCLCNALLCAVDLVDDIPIVTAGNTDLVRGLMDGPDGSYTAEDVIRAILPQPE